MKSRQLPEKQNAGLTLIEIVIAMSILAFGAIAALSLLVEAHKSNNVAQAKSRAIAAAEEQLEIIFNSPPGSVAAPGNWPPFEVPGLRGPGGAPAGNVAIIPPTFPSEPYKVRVTVDWEGQGSMHGGHVMIEALRSQAER